VPPIGQSGLHRLAVPVFSATHELVAALGIAMPLDAVTDLGSLQEVLVSQLQAAAERIVNGDG
jgi:DNA-binding IclR family transcriptional regulator